MSNLLKYKGDGKFSHQGQNFFFFEPVLFSEIFIYYVLHLSFIVIHKGICVLD